MLPLQIDTSESKKFSERRSGALSLFEKSVIFLVSFSIVVIFISILGVFFE